jgi:hypothetical protein
MNFFRSEDHARRSADFSPDAEGGLLPLRDVMSIFSAPAFRERRNGRYMSRRPALRAELLATVKAVTNNHPFWRPAPG